MILFITLFFFISLTTSAIAYIGPGLGVALVGYAFGPIIAIVATVILIAYFPLRYYYKKHKRLKREKAEFQQKPQDKDNQ